jgi:uncharacterized protein YukE
MMRSFPALGFDPAPGDRGAVTTVLTSLGEAEVTLAEVAPRMAEAIKKSDDWSGDAADSFHSTGDDLPKAFNSGSESLQATTKALTTWGSQLVANQAQADQLEQRAKTLKAELKAAGHAMDEAAGNLPHDTGNPHYTARYDAYLSTVDKWSKLNSALQKVIDDAHRLQARHLREANTAASAIRSGPDDAFQPQQGEGWLMQAVGLVGKVSGLISSASAVVAAGSLVIPGVGEVVAPVAGTVAGATGAVSGLAGLAQRIGGDPHAPGVLDIALNLVPGRTVTSGAKGVVEGAIKGGLKDAAKQGAKEGLTSAGLGAAIKNVRDIRTLAEESPSLAAALRAKSGKDLLDKGEGVAKAVGQQDASDAVKRAMGRARSTNEAFVNTVDFAVKSFDAAGVQLTPAQKRELELLKLATNPGRAQLENAGVNVTKETLKQHGVGN